MSNDTFIATAGNDEFHGGTGNDSVTLAGNASGYQIEVVDGLLRVTDIDISDGDTGIDTLSSIETLIFSDREYNTGSVATGSAEIETSINTTTTGVQQIPVVVGLIGGGYVVTWESSGQDGAGKGIYAQLYDVNGVKVGNETRINTTTTSDQYDQAVTALTDGGYVVTWTSSGQDGSGTGIYAQRYDAEGTAVGSETQINTYTTSFQSYPSIAALADGGYVITWSSADQDGHISGVYSQRYDSDGIEVGDETQINTTTAGTQNEPSVTGLADGGYVITWQSDNQDGSSLGVYAQCFDADGVAVGSETLINTYTSNSQLDPAVSALADGGYVITWCSYQQDGSDYGIYAQRYDAAGDVVGSETRINTYTTNMQFFQSISALEDGGYVITWSSFGQDGDGMGVYARRFNADGTAVSSETLVNTSTAGVQSAPSVAALSDGGYIVTWLASDADNYGIFAQRFNAEGSPYGPVALEITGTAAADNIIAGVGAQRLKGLTGADILSGGLGDDTYILSDTDTIVENQDEGTDTVETSVTFTLGDNLENLLLTGSDNINGTGNALANTITGNGGNNILDGKAGTDALEGGAGNDTYVIADADLIIENSGSGTDTVKAAFSYTLGTNLEYLTLTGSAHLNGTGNSLVNTITGNSGNNILDGKTGKDTLKGGTGNDTYIIADADTIAESASAGTDLVKAAITYTLGSNLENLTLTGSSAISGTGNTLTNLVTGNAGNNILNGKAGNDTLTGGAGKDIFRFDTTLSASTNKDTIKDYSAASDALQLDNAIFKKLTATGTLKAANFKASTSGNAADKDDFILYETDTGKLFYDADGNGAGAKVQFALIGTSTHPALSASEFMVM